MKRTTKSTKQTHRPFFLYDVVHSDGSVIEQAVSLPTARRMVQTWNEVSPVPEASIRKAWRVVPIGASERKAVK